VEVLARDRGLPGDLRVVRDPYIGGVSQAHEWLKPMRRCRSNRIAFDADGLVNEPAKEWFDVYDFQGPDAFSNAADYRAFLCMADVESLAGRSAQAKRTRTMPNASTRSTSRLL